MPYLYLLKLLAFISCTLQYPASLQWILSSYFLLILLQEIFL